MITEAELKLARRVAKRVGSRWSAVELEDLESELIVWLFENEKIVDRYRGEDGGEGKLFVALRRRAVKLSAREQSVRSGLPLDAGSRYSIQQIERGLPFIFEETPQTVLAENPVTGSVVGSASPESSTVALAILLDLRGAVEQLSEELREVVVLRFRDGMTYHDIAGLVGLTDNGARKRVRRALRSAQQFLDGE